MPTPHDSRFYIVNDFDRPSEDHIAEKREDGLFYYIHPRLAKWPGMNPTNPTPLDAFGLSYSVRDGLFQGDLTHSSSATYRDGRTRKWQGSTRFDFPYNFNLNAA